MLSQLGVTKVVETPVRAEPVAASIPAWPPPTTITGWYAELDNLEATSAL